MWNLWSTLHGNHGTMSQTYHWHDINHIFGGPSLYYFIGSYWPRQLSNYIQNCEKEIVGCGNAWQVYTINILSLLKGKWPRFVHEANLSDSIDFLNAVFHQVCVEWDFIWIYDLKVVLRKSAEIIRHFCSLGKTHRALYILSLFASSCLQQADRYKGPILTQGPM